jgi:hypothetical protein
MGGFAAPCCSFTVLNCHYLEAGRSHFSGSLPEFIMGLSGGAKMFIRGDEDKLYIVALNL